METTARTRGTIGESIAALFLESRGYTIVERNVRVGRNEIDLLVERGEWIVAVEVKWRYRGSSAEPVENVWSHAQRRRMASAALDVIQRLPGGAERPWRFDLVLIEERVDGLVLTHRRGAWSPADHFW